ncbi:MAG: hypothetical protein Q8R53_02020 [Nanoarchaeota archaeon]|nr:hypothetical protein [Nanoarchaeota archaeon]
MAEQEIPGTLHGKVGLIARFKPLHNGGAMMLEKVCSQADAVTIGIGSSNKYTVRNPFTAEESAALVRAYLSPRYENYTIVHVPDFGHIPEYRNGQKWRETVLQLFGSLDYFVTGNPYTRDLLQEDYHLIHPAWLLLPEEQFRLRATEVRIKMARGEDWQSLVPHAVCEYLQNNGLVERFCREFGEETLRIADDEDGRHTATADEEHRWVKDS